MRYRSIQMDKRLTSHRDVSLYYGKGSVIEPFIDRIFLTSGITDIVWVSPWVTHMNFRRGSTKQLLDQIRVNGTRLTLVTRKPESGYSKDEHQGFVEDCCRIDSCEIFFLANLHAKYYICHALRRSFALIGSPNLYRWSVNAFELGVVIEGRGEGEVLVRGLDDITMELRSSRDKEIYKRYSSRRKGKR